MLSWHSAGGHTWHTFFFFTVCSGLPHFPWTEWMLEAGKIETGRQTDRQTDKQWGRVSAGKACALTQSGGKGIPLWDGSFLHLDWSVAWSSAATRGPHAASPPLVMLTAKIKRILSYSFICNVETAWPTTISQGYYSCHVKTPQRQAEIFGFSYLYNSAKACLTEWSEFIRSLCADERIYHGQV